MFLAKPVAVSQPASAFSGLLQRHRIEPTTLLAVLLDYVAVHGSKAGELIGPQ